MRIQVSAAFRRDLMKHDRTCVFEFYERAESTVKLFKVCSFSPPPPP